MPRPAIRVKFSGIDMEGRDQVRCARSASKTPCTGFRIGAKSSLNRWPLELLVKTSPRFETELGAYIQANAVTSCEMKVLQNSLVMSEPIPVSR